MIALVGLILISTGAGFAASVAVPASRLSETIRPAGPNDLKPTECAGLTLTNIVIGSGNIDGTGGNDLIFGSAGADSIKGLGGGDCILGGGGDDDINGNGGGDICIGGPGTDTIKNCATTIP
ncbi:MAG: hypothetical protein HY782_20090 [Chloroflexi bacterium]|nr:hypothetical protein [Chloroflexota bacterium]